MIKVEDKFWKFLLILVRKLLHIHLLKKTLKTGIYKNIFLSLLVIHMNFIYFYEERTLAVSISKYIPS
jgi:hypothetical protein